MDDLERGNTHTHTGCPTILHMSRSGKRYWTPCIMWRYYVQGGGETAGSLRHRQLPADKNSLDLQRQPPPPPQPALRLSTKNKEQNPPTPSLPRILFLHCIHFYLYISGRYLSTFYLQPLLYGQWKMKTGNEIINTVTSLRIYRILVLSDLRKT